MLKPVEVKLEHPEDEKVVSLLTSLTKSSSSQGSMDLHNSNRSSFSLNASTEMASMDGQMQQSQFHHPHVPLSVVTFRKEELLLYMQRYKHSERPLKANSSTVCLNIPTAMNDASCVMVQRNYADLGIKPVGALVSPTTHEPIAYLIPTTNNQLNAPHALLTPHAPDKEFYTYSYHLPIAEK